MRYEVSVDIEAPRDKVVAIFADPKRAPDWQPGLLSIEALEGPPGAEGSTARLVFKQGKGTMTMKETITRRELPSAFHGTYETAGVWSLTENYFEALAPNRTRVRCVNEFRFSKLIYKLMAALFPGTFRKQSLVYLQGFKRICEA